MDIINSPSDNTVTWIYSRIYKKTSEHFHMQLDIWVCTGCVPFWQPTPVHINEVWFTPILWKWSLWNVLSYLAIQKQPLKIPRYFCKSWLMSVYNYVDDLTVIFFALRPGHEFYYVITLGQILFTFNAPMWQVRNYGTSVLSLFARFGFLFPPWQNRMGHNAFWYTHMYTYQK